MTEPKVSPVAPGSPTDEIGRYLLGMRERANGCDIHGEFMDAILNVIVHDARETLDDDVSKMDDHFDQICASLKAAARQAALMNQALDAAEAGRLN